VTQWLKNLSQLTLAASGGAIYTVSSTTSTTITLTSGTGITAGTGLAFIAYPHGAGDGSTTFTLPDSRGRTKVGQSLVGTQAQPSHGVGATFGLQSIAILQNQLPTTIGSAAGQTVTVPEHTHSFPGTDVLTGVPPGGGGSGLAAGNTVFGNTALVTSGASPVLNGNVTAAASAVTNSGGGQLMDVSSPSIGSLWMIRAL
jgi:microcystin-dependent protein